MVCVGLTDKVLLEYGNEHVKYELDMLIKTHEILESNGAIILNRTTINALIESRALHFRNLYFFLIAEKTKVRDTDVIAQRFDEEFLFNNSELLKKLKEQCDKQIAHLTMNRVSDAQQKAGQGSKSWEDIKPGIVELLKEMSRFTSSVNIPVTRMPTKLSDAVYHYSKTYSP